MALNKFIGMGRITAPVELKNTPSGVSVVTFTIAIDRDYKGQNGESHTDFLNIVAWRQTAEFISRYFGKGSLICIEGSVQTRSYTTNGGEKRYVTEVVADKVYFTGEKKENAAETKNNAPEPKYEPIDDEADLPF